MAHRPPLRYFDIMVTVMKERKLSRFRPGKEYISNLGSGLSDKLVRDLIGIGRFWISLGVSTLPLSFRIDSLRFADPPHYPRHPF